MSVLAVKAVQIAKSFIGQEEVPRGSNWGHFPAQCLAHVGIHSPAPWCAAFVALCVDAAADSLNLPNTWLQGTDAASCTAVHAWAKEHGRLLDAPQANCVFLVPSAKEAGVFVHTGFVISVGYAALSTVEGNTDPAGSPEGYCVAKRIRQPHNLVYVQI